MTRERRLAVQMWWEIAEHIRCGNIKNILDIVQYKKEFCQRNGLRWLFGCYLCKYRKQKRKSQDHRALSCSGCLLFEHYGRKNCAHRGNPYAELKEVDPYFCRKPYTAEHARYADEIADVLEGKKK